MLLLPRRVELYLPSLILLVQGGLEGLTRLSQFIRRSTKLTYGTTCSLLYLTWRRFDHTTVSLPAGCRYPEAGISR